MFYCDTCRKKHEWPTSMSKSRGSCEVCGENAVCNDLPSSRLLMPKAASAPLQVDEVKNLTESGYADDSNIIQ